MGKGLTPKQERFVEEYLVDLNATQAAIRAGYCERTARSQGQRLLTNADIQAALSAAMEARSARTGITQDAVLQELQAIAFAGAADWTDSKLKYANKLKALELLGKHLGMFTEKAKLEVGNLAGRPLELLDMSKLTDDQLRELAAGQ